MEYYNFIESKQNEITTSKPIIFFYYIDILRATSTFTTLFHLGVKSIKVFKEPEIAYDYFNKYLTIDNNNFNNLLLCGEKNSIKPDNFFLGNSPLEYINYNKLNNNFLLDKNIIFTSTNGAKIISHNIENLQIYYKSINQFILSFLNIEENVNYLVNNIMSNIKSENQNDSDFTDFEIILVCGGENGEISIEDTICAIMFKYQILSKINKSKYNSFSRINYFEKDNIKIEKIENELFGELFCENNQNSNRIEFINELILNNYKEYIYQNSKHILRLKELNFEKDIEFCLEINKFNSILFLEKNCIFNLNH